jgi:hypothetical protein
MHDLILARLIHEEREREIARDLRARAAREALEGCRRDVFVPSARETRRTPGFRPSPAGGRTL